MPGTDTKLAEIGIQNMTTPDNNMEGTTLTKISKDSHQGTPPTELLPNKIDKTTTTPQPKKDPLWIATIVANLDTPGGNVDPGTGRILHGLLNPGKPETGTNLNTVSTLSKTPARHLIVLIQETQALHSLLHHHNPLELPHNNLTTPTSRETKLTTATWCSASGASTYLP